MKLRFMFILLVLVTQAGAQQVITGTWKGKIAAFDLTVVFNISTKNGSLVATMDSPDQGAMGIACDQVVINNNEVTISVAVIGGKYTGTFTPDYKLIRGKWSQGGGSFDLDLGKDAVPATRARPQTPQPPFGYTVEEVEYDNADKTAHLAGTLTYPAGGGPYPVAILVSGSGQQDRDESIMGHKPFAVLADRLTKLGFAVLRVDDRGVGKSTGEVAKASSADFAKDLAAGIEYLKTRKEIDRERIGLVGHSEGGLISALLAAERKDIHFMVLLAGPGIRGGDLLAEQGAQLLAQSGVSAEALQNYLPFYKKMIARSAAGGDSAAIAADIRAAYHTWKGQSNPELVKQVGFTDITSAESILVNLTQAFSSAWMQFFLASDAGELLRKTNAKVLALNGEKDVQVLPVSNTEGLKKALAKSASPLYEVKVLPGLNHLFQRCNACTVAEYGMLDETIAPSALEEITGWLQRNVLHR